MLVDHHTHNLFTTAHPSSMGLELGRQVALSLARLATLQGYPITYREFESLTLNLDVKTSCGATLAENIATLWQSRFPQARVHTQTWPPKPGDLPALWLGPRHPVGTNSVLTVLGTLTNGALSSLDEKGLSVVLQPERACHGRLLVLKPGALGHSEPSSATGAEPALPALCEGWLTRTIRRWLGSRR